ncbi:GNAT family N-acetyltransferase [Vibrio cholerae]|uniref:GNAT family N-acetyltransferase n=1 Tax=Vibrio TaxID=662 RepID=UPI0005B48FD4|nr:MULTISPECIES: GNAT family N-acetyltransferase [Vibrio]EGQ9441015.1 GNAT family N-acetyltransferase [Vibrio cholerae]EGR1452126.1 GNAT family N-acetyltransferase [Vibrio cholerae]EGR1860766.1 GNAT family N-acetyltransferase [Vibrio cholerae]EHP3509363.1 GNAT family N-acetyltransferase [Vibrio cholerae]EIE9613245.1 GNAT family N-acetyltransferase [Vibrio cholerae]
MKVHLLKDSTDLRSVAEVLLTLRPDFDLESLSAQILKQQSNGYKVAYVKSGDAVLGVAGFCICEKLAWGKHIYIDDLVTNSEVRSKGVGKLLIDWFKSYAIEEGCGQIHLDSGVQRFLAHKFYLREGFIIGCHHFSLVV